MSAFFITATGTGVGKTLVTCALARQSRRAVRALKPIITGYPGADPDTSDSHLILKALGERATGDAVNRISPWRYAAPMAPDAAAALEDRRVDFAALVDYCRDAMASAPDNLLIEGIGGAFVPLAGDLCVADWIAALDIPCILVAGSYLGSLSHTISTIEAMAARGLAIGHVVISQKSPGDAPPDHIAAALAPFLGGIPVGQISHLEPGSEIWRAVPDLKIFDSASATH